jgi:hypothetical protein
VPGEPGQMCQIKILVAKYDQLSAEHHEAVKKAAALKIDMEVTQRAIRASAKYCRGNCGCILPKTD